MLPSAKRAILSTIALAGAVLPAHAHVGAGLTSSFTAGFAHPLRFDHVTVMIAVGLWAAQKGGRAIWALPAAFIAVMLAGAGFGLAHVPVLFVEPAILASIVALGLMVALAVDLPARVASPLSRPSASSTVTRTERRSRPEPAGWSTWPASQCRLLCCMFSAYRPHLLWVRGCRAWCAGRALLARAWCRPRPWHDLELRHDAGRSLDANDWAEAHRRLGLAGRMGR
ncbi:hypothetical protein HNQ71_001885 [Mesorhizobium sangaii]|uniref:HupE/UreJ family protein n=1 Tax=Mesorhizobium sangaii TaxID=505389 RepID=A0A841PEH0_9HYPH|nr:hypothetical protein [Mesorhizobium sangaii]